jgi:hypothetical protein
MSQTQTQSVERDSTLSSKGKKIVIHIFSFLFVGAVIEKVKEPRDVTWMKFLFFRNFSDYRQQ